MVFAKGLSFPEGPVTLPDGSWLCVEGGAERGCITRISPDGKSNRIVAETGRPNGLAVDKHGFIWVAESKMPSLLRVSLDGGVEVIATECDGEPFLFPNDLCLGPVGFDFHSHQLGSLARARAFGVPAVYGDAEERLHKEGFETTSRRCKASLRPVGLGLRHRRRRDRLCG